ncbi:unnamed protein product [Phaeothamnion confervicola]
MDLEYAEQVAERFGARLRELRSKAGITQAALGKKCGVRQASIAEYERGRSSPSWPYVVRLAFALGVTPDAFTAIPGEKENRNFD